MVQQTKSQPLDVSGFEDYYLHDSHRLIRFLLTLGASAPDAEDTAQEAMKAALLNWPALNHPRAFVRQVARRALYRRWENDRKRTHGEQVAAQSAPKLVEIDFDDDSRELFAMLRTLSATQREVMAWTIEGYTTEQVAGETGLEPATVRSHLRHARQNLRRQLHERHHCDGKERCDDR
jgi:RNA polymerase sigma factor (sigma-70 family)